MFRNLTRNIKNVQKLSKKCGGCFAPTDPVQDILLSFRAAWNRVSVGFVFLLVRVSAVGRRAAPHGRTGRADRTGRTDRTGLRGGLERIDSDGNVASCQMASCFCWRMLSLMLAHCQLVCFAMPCFAMSCRDKSCAESHRS